MRQKKIEFHPVNHFMTAVSQLSFRFSDFFPQLLFQWDGSGVCIAPMDLSYIQSNPSRLCPKLSFLADKILLHQTLSKGSGQKIVTTHLFTTMASKRNLAQHHGLHNAVIITNSKSQWNPRRKSTSSSLHVREILRPSNDFHPTSECPRRVPFQAGLLLPFLAVTKLCECLRKLHPILYWRLWSYASKSF